MLLNVRQILVGESQPSRILLAMEDITDNRPHELLLKQPHGQKALCHL
jgi:hypothetical protein